MNKVYNTQEDMARGFEIFLLAVDPNIRKTQLNMSLIHNSEPTRSPSI